MKRQKDVPTSTELQLLKILWTLGPSTVRQVHQRVSEVQEVGYTTVLKMFQIMHEKGLVTRDESSRAHIYKANYTEAQTQSSIVSDMLNKAFGGSKSELVLRALGESASREEIAEIRRVLDSLESNNK
ncbi:BlaI/MecI/CopY family transcriptional regulator [Aestuariibacter salexigens]|uniref:BlaI/MecI/CopY family transcriptional regulator n=1 Tax=Aestuariibacter salexigens TaxID=226010 RepID=UPI0003FE2488|nr:BlaI/MecI/CopY family transcriptional regulator [Aestuariibacter salexigens]